MLQQMQPHSYRFPQFKLSLLDPIQRATQSHNLHHQNARSFRHQFKITREQARKIVKQCGGCTSLLSEPHLGVNPRGLLPNHIWQMDVTHILSFRNTPMSIPLLTPSQVFCLPPHRPEKLQNISSVIASKHLPQWAFQRSLKLTTVLAILAKLFKIFVTHFRFITSQVFLIIHKVKALLKVPIDPSKSIN